MKEGEIERRFRINRYCSPSMGGSVRYTLVIEWWQNDKCIRNERVQMAASEFAALLSEVMGAAAGIGP